MTNMNRSDIVGAFNSQPQTRYTFKVYFGMGLNGFLAKLARQGMAVTWADLVAKSSGSAFPTRNSTEEEKPIYGPKRDQKGFFFADTEPGKYTKPLRATPLKVTPTPDGVRCYTWVEFEVVS